MKWLIWSVEQGAWLGVNGRGFAITRKEAGTWTLEAAQKMCENFNGKSNTPTFTIAPEAE